MSLVFIFFVKLPTFSYYFSPIQSDSSHSDVLISFPTFSISFPTFSIPNLRTKQNTTKQRGEHGNGTLCPPNSIIYLLCIFQPQVPNSNNFSPKKTNPKEKKNRIFFRKCRDSLLLDAQLRCCRIERGWGLVSLLPFSLMIPRNRFFIIVDYLWFFLFTMIQWGKLSNGFLVKSLDFLLLIYTELYWCHVWGKMRWFWELEWEVRDSA